MTPTFTKDQKRFNRLIEKGEERLNNYINADYIWDVIMEHHNILKKLNKTDIPLRDEVYDYVLNIDSDEEGSSDN